MDNLFSFLFFAFIIFSVVIRVKQAAKKMKQQGAPKPGGSVNPPPPPAQDFKFILMQGFNVPQPQGAAKTLIGSKDMDKVVLVYGTGAVLGTDEVFILLNTTVERAQQILDQLLSSGRAQQTTSTSGKIRYKLI